MYIYKDTKSNELLILGYKKYWHSEDRMSGFGIAFTATANTLYLLLFVYSAWILLNSRGKVK